MIENLVRTHCIYGAWQARVTQTATRPALPDAELAHALARAAIEYEITSRHQDDVLHGIEGGEVEAEEGGVTRYLFTECGPVGAQ